MKKILSIVAALFAAFILAGCNESQTKREAQGVENQQAQYEKGQPVPAFNFSVEREKVIQLYILRNSKIATHTVWRSMTGKILFDCPSMGYGIPYDTSLTNPFKRVADKYGAAAVSQPEPNGLFASTATSATWVMCIAEGGALDPIYVESEVNTYPFPLNVDYDKDRVTKAGKTSVKAQLRQ